MTRQPVGWQAVFFDFDGVIVDSVGLKTEAFAAMFEQHGPAVVEEVVRYHLEHGGLSRVRKFAHYYETFFNRKLGESELAALSRTFSAMVVDRVVAAPLMPGAEESLKVLEEQGIPAFVVSGVPEEEIRDVVVRKGLGGFFREVHGSPRLKPDILRDLLGRHRLNPGCCLFLGDALTDYHAARETGIPFLGIVPEGSVEVLPVEVCASPVIRLDLRPEV